MKLSDKISIAPHVIAREVGQETVLLDLESGTYFGLDGTGTRIWQLIEEGKSLSEVCDIMMSEYDVARDVIETDTIVLLAELEEKKLVSAA